MPETRQGDPTSLIARTHTHTNIYMQLLKSYNSTHANMDIIKECFLSVTAFLILVRGRLRYLTITQTSQNPEKQPLHSDNMASEMLQPQLQALHPSFTPPSSPAVNLESQLPESQPQPSLTNYNRELYQTLETQPLHFTANNTEILLLTTQSQAPHLL